MTPPYINPVSSPAPAKFPEAPPEEVFEPWARNTPDTAEQDTVEHKTKGPTKAEQCLAYIREHGPATREQIGGLLGINRAHIRNYLTAALRRRALVFNDEGLLDIGPGKAPARTKAARKAAQADSPKPAPSSARASQPEEPASLSGADGLLLLHVGKTQFVMHRDGSTSLRPAPEPDPGVLLLLAICKLRITLHESLGLLIQSGEMQVTMSEADGLSIRLNNQAMHH